MADSTTSDTIAQASSIPRTAAKPSGPRRLMLTILGVIVVIGIIFYAAFAFLMGDRTVETDNAYVGAESAEVTPLVAGPVARVLVLETQQVKAGDLLVVIDDADAKIAVAQAKAALGAQVSARAADITRANAMIAGAQSDLERAKTDLDRREALAASGAVSGDELTAAHNRYDQAKSELLAAQATRDQARASLVAAQGSQKVNTVLISGGDVNASPEVQAAQARLDTALSLIHI